MPATEQTWRSPGLLHVVFGVTSLMMLVATIWMFAKDHTREWKDYQKAHNAVGQFYTKGREQEARSVQFAKDLAQANADLAEAKALPVSSEDVAEFKVEVEAEAKRLEIAPFDLTEAEVNSGATDGDGEADDAKKRRETVLRILNAAIADAKHREDTLLQKRKFAAANVTAFLSLRDLAVHEGRSEEIVAERQAKVDEANEEVENLSTEYTAASMHRKRLEAIKKRITDPVSEAEAVVVKVNADVKRYQDGVEGIVTKIGRTVLGMPILDAFDNSDLTIDQIWLPTLTINYNFSNVARFDRCITCHRANATSRPGSPTDPAYEHEELPFTVMLSTPDEMPADEAVEEKEEVDPTKKEEKSFLDGDELILRKAYGLMLAPNGILNSNDVTIQVVWPKVGDEPARAAEAGLKMGDVIVSIGGTPVLNRKDALARLVGEVTWGQPVEITIRRGLPHPFASHPRLDLFCGSTSPHKQGEMGCTICHDGQGSATAFKWASHTPNNPTIASEWDQEHGWFDNHHWIFPMYPQRFVESGCLKCHHEVVELRPSPRFPEPPAPKLMAGYDLVRQYGCFGCHEINGYDGPNKRIGPDLRAEPNFYAVAQALLLEDSLTPEERSWAEELVHHPERNLPRSRLYEAIQEDKKLRVNDNAPKSVEAEADETEGEKLAARFTPTAYRLGAQLKAVESPGTLRKPGPSLRYIASKADFDFLYDWVRKPSSYRPSTKMPQFFGLWEHLSEGEQAETASLESMEIRGITKYLLDSSKPFEYDAPLEGITAESSVARGAFLFQTRGCLACHSHADYPGINNDQGPDLSMLATKFASEAGSKWLYTWLRDPSKYHVRTKMPNMLLEPIKGEGGEVSDPIADIVAFLNTTGIGIDVSVDGDEVQVTRVAADGPSAGKLHVGDILVSIGQASTESASDQDSEQSVSDVLVSLRGAPGSKLSLVVRSGDSEETKTVEVNRAGYQPESVPDAELTEEQQKTLYDLALESLKKVYPLPTAKRYLDDGITDIDAGTIKGDDVVLVGEMNPSNRTDKLLLYVGRRAISKYGCSGCHDIPSYEDAKPIGTGLADWGRKDASRLAFEQITQFLPLHGGGHAASHAAHGGDLPPYELTEAEIDTPDTQFFFEAITHHNRQGFIWQKLRQPRTYDYQKVSNKEYNDRLRMPEFPFDDQQREQVITFVLGLVAEPPASQYIYTPDPRQDAIVKGQQVLEKFNCAGCHALTMEQWDFAFHPDDENYESPPEMLGYPFLAAHATPEEIEDSLETDSKGMRKATIHGRPLLNEETGHPLLFNEDIDPVEPGEEAEAEELYYSFELWDQAVINGHLFQAGGPSLLVKDSTSKKYPAVGGSLPNYLFPVVVADEKDRNPQVKGSEAWGWLPPPLVGEGEKVQTSWLHKFLLDPTPIRPAVVLRMPKFNMSPDEASALANYFAAVDRVDYPYEFDSRTASMEFEAMEAAHPGRLKDALGIVVNNTYCVKCHLVGDFAPAGSTKAMGPNLASVYERLRPEYTRRWVADPKRILPYTGMPVNIPYKPEPPLYGGIAQEIFKGTSFEQLDGLVDLLMNYDVFTNQEVSIKPLVKKPPVEGESPSAEGAEKPADNESGAEAKPAETPPVESTPTPAEEKTPPAVENE